MRKGQYKVGPAIIKTSTRHEGRYRVVGCKRYHFYLKNLTGHLEKVHNITQSEHKKLPLSRLSILISESKKKHPVNKYRQIEICMHPKCASICQPYMDLNHHLRKRHAIARKEYNEMRSIESKEDVLGCVKTNVSEQVLVEEETVTSQEDSFAERSELLPTSSDSEVDEEEFDPSDSLFSDDD